MVYPSDSRIGHSSLEYQNHQFHFQFQFYQTQRHKPGQLLIFLNQSFLNSHFPFPILHFHFVKFKFYPSPHNPNPTVLSLVLVEYSGDAGGKPLGNFVTLLRDPLDLHLNSQSNIQVKTQEAPSEYWNLVWGFLKSGTLKIDYFL